MRRIAARAPSADLVQTSAESLGAGNHHPALPAVYSGERGNKDDLPPPIRQPLTPVHARRPYLHRMVDGTAAGHHIVQITPWRPAAAAESIHGRRQGVPVWA